MSEPHDAVSPLPKRLRLPSRRAHLAIDFQHGGTSYTAGLGFHPDGTLGELFINSRKYGTGAGVAAGDAAVAASLCLQHGCAVDVLRHAMIRDPDGTASGVLGTALDLLARELGIGDG